MRNAFAAGLPAIVLSSVALGFGSFNESHPYQNQLICDRAPGNVLVGRMYDISTGTRVPVTQFNRGHVGACELAIRAARNHRVCVEKSNQYAIYDLRTKATSTEVFAFANCLKATRGGQPLRTESGYVDFIPNNELKPFLDRLPNVADLTINAKIRSSRTIWYDESSMIYTYQDSFGSPKGLRANRVGYDVGSNAESPDIQALTDYFKAGKFKFPFSISAGADFSENVYVLNFWLPPTNNGSVLPVRTWKNRSHWQWVFPVGTVFGEVLFLQAPDDQEWFAFELRTRRRDVSGWQSSVWRPFLQPVQLAESIRAMRPDWQTSDLAPLVANLEGTGSVTQYKLEAPTYVKIFPAINGAMDFLPATSDFQLIKQLLTSRVFEKADGSVWRGSNFGNIYAPTTMADFHIVPKQYIGGMLEVSDSACKRCHDQTSRPLNNLERRIVLYGEIWGEDEIFTWHPFNVDVDAFSVADGNRSINQRLVTAGLVVEGVPNDPVRYSVLPKPYVAEYE